jgi:hypothetical protein
MLVGKFQTSHCLHHLDIDIESETVEKTWVGLVDVVCAVCGGIEVATDDDEKSVGEASYEISVDFAWANASFELLALVVAWDCCVWIGMRDGGAGGGANCGCCCC